MTDVSFTSLTQWFPGHTVIPLWPSTQPRPRPLRLVSATAAVMKWCATAKFLRLPGQKWWWLNLSTPTASVFWSYPVAAISA